MHKATTGLINRSLSWIWQMVSNIINHYWWPPLQTHSANSLHKWLHTQT